MTDAQKLAALRDHESALRLAWKTALADGTITALPKIANQLVAVRKQILDMPDPAQPEAAE